jgi:hypothetical protein
MGGGRRPGPVNDDPFSGFIPQRTPGPLGRNDAADPGALTLRGNTPGSLGVHDDAAFQINRIVDPLDFDYLVRHRESKSHLVESSLLSRMHLADKRNLWKSQSIWGVGGAVVFRLTNLAEDLDGSGHAYHPPTDASWSGYGHGLGKDSLANAVGNPGVTKYAHSKNEKDWALTAGCQLFRDLHKAKELEPKAAPAQPHPGKAATPGQPGPESASKDAKDAKDALDAIFKKYGVTKISELETKSNSAVCVLYVEGRSKEDSRADWSHVVHWAGIQVDKSGKPIIRASGPNKGFFAPRITPGWADAEKHPWVVLNTPQDQFGVKLTNSAVVIKNGDPPTIAYGMVGDAGPPGHLGEVSRKMMDDLGFTGATPAGDYIVIQFPKNVSEADMAQEKDVPTIQSDAKDSFEAWTWEGRSGLQLIKELFPTPEQYHEVQKTFANAKQYLNPYIDQMLLKLK